MSLKFSALLVLTCCPLEVEKCPLEKRLLGNLEYSQICSVVLPLRFVQNTGYIVLNCSLHFIDLLNVIKCDMFRTSVLLPSSRKKYGNLPVGLPVRASFIPSTSSFPFPFVPLQRRGCLLAPLFL
jgi:hypothetical protein